MQVIVLLVRLIFEMQTEQYQGSLPIHEMKFPDFPDNFKSNSLISE